MQTLVSLVPTAFKRRFLKILMKTFHINPCLLSFTWSIKLFIVDYKINHLNGFLIFTALLLTFYGLKLLDDKIVNDEKYLQRNYLGLK